MFRRALPVMITVILAVPTAALGAQRYASPTGSGADCSAASPCTAFVAVSAAVDGDEVIIGPGTYASSGQMDGTGRTLDIHGEFGQPAPLFAPPNLSSEALLYVGAGSSVRHLRVTIGAGNTTGILVDGNDVHFDRVAIDTTSPNPMIDLVSGVTGTAFTNSAFVRTVGSRDALEIGRTNTDVTIDFTTIRSTDPAGGALAVTDGSRATIRNSVLDGTTSDLRVGASLSNATVRSSNFRPSKTTVDASGTLVNGAGNQMTAPLFAGPTDFHQTAGSPTIDAANPGISPTTMTDIDGDARLAGASADIGADEWSGAPSLTGVGADTSTATVVVRAQLMTGGLATSVVADVGATTAYGATTSPVDVAGNVMSIAVAVPIAGLTGGTTVHLRLRATNAKGEAASADLSVAVPDRTAPTLTKLRLSSNPIFSGASPRVRSTLGERSTVRLRIQRRLAGRTKGTTCVPGRATGARCVKLVGVTTINAGVLRAGAVAVKVPARIRGARLARGSYLLTLTATDAAGNRSTRIAILTVK